MTPAGTEMLRLKADGAFAGAVVLDIIPKGFGHRDYQLFFDRKSVQAGYADSVASVYIMVERETPGSTRQPIFFRNQKA